MLASTKLCVYNYIDNLEVNVSQGDVHLFNLLSPDNEQITITYNTSQSINPIFNNTDVIQFQSECVWIIQIEIIGTTTNQYTDLHIHNMNTQHQTRRVYNQTIDETFIIFAKQSADVVLMSCDMTIHSVIV